MGYAYTYDARDDYVGLDALSDEARGLGYQINQKVRDRGDDRIDFLRASTASPEAKAALAEVWGGPGAGKEFQP